MEEMSSVKFFQSTLPYRERRDYIVSNKPEHFPFNPRSRIGSDRDHFNPASSKGLKTL